MGKNKTDDKKKKKNSQLVVRVDRAERDAFVGMCDRLDTTAAREIRRFMREWTAAQVPPDPAAAEPAAAPDVTPPAAEPAPTDPPVRRSRKAKTPA
jgi:hypothetical protein